jgi:hypothetical protein
MVTILVFDGAGKTDPEKIIRHFKRAYMANGIASKTPWSAGRWSIIPRDLLHKISLTVTQNSSSKSDHHGI